ncbi:alpha/beta hydrolase [Olivibacter sp. XZL3]|uniref:alpha/beta hydrolase n=1 Tax=Olivibacter sp. XZL3 TaxID=1735116 RepID=UPI00141701D2|nr:alpha/beta hydrolase [Olivibacter sp. XZL3]
MYSFTVADCKDAIRWIRKNASNYHFDNNQIGIWGASAGGNLALLTAYSPPDSFPGDKTLLAYSSSVNFVIDNFGPVDLNQLLRTDVSAFKGNIFKLFYKEKYQRRRDKLYELTGLDVETDGQKVVEKCSLYSPIQYVSRTSVPTLILHGTADETVNLKQSEILYKKLKVQGVPGSRFITYKNLTHGFKNANVAQIAEITKSSIDFVQAQINQ